jgi:hypothetical protein
MDCYSWDTSYQVLYTQVYVFVFLAGTGLTEGITKAFHDIFTHTTIEKAEFVRDFLINLGVEK